MIAEDDLLYARTLQRSLRKRGFDFEAAANIEEALEIAATRGIELAIVDLYLGAQSGLDLVASLRQNHPEARILVLTGYGTVDTAVEATKRGADNYLLKPATVEAILHALLADSGPREPSPTKMTPLGRLEWSHIQRALRTTTGNISAAARLLGMHRRSLQRNGARSEASPVAGRLACGIVMEASARAETSPASGVTSRSGGRPPSRGTVCRIAAGCRVPD